MNSDTKQILAFVLVVVMVASAGCAGWGQDGPADNDTEQNNDSADLGQTQNESENQSDSNASDDPGDDGSSSGENGVANGGDSDTSDDSPDSEDDTNGDDPDSGENETPSDSDDPDENETDPDDPDENETATDNKSDLDDPAPDEGNTVIVDVRHLDTDEPVEIPVRLSNQDFSETTTASDGTAVFENVPAGTYEVKDEADGWWPEYGAANQVTVDGDTSYTLGVRDAPDTHTLTVKVTDAETGDPVEGVDISGVGDRHPDGSDMLMGGETNSDGVLVQDVYESGYHITVSSDGYEPMTKEVVVDSDTSVSFELVPEEPETHTLTTTVTDATGDPLDGASVSIVTYDGGEDVASATADENGQATFDLEDGSYEVIASHDGYAQPSDNRLVEIDGEDATFEVALESTDGDQQYAPASAIDVESVKHGGAEPFTDYDRITLANTHDELPLDVSGWSISVSKQTPEMPIPDGTVIAPGETYVVVLDAEDKMLDASGGVLQIYTADGSEVLSWNYVGSPSNPYMPENNNESGDVNEANANQTAAAV